MLMPNKAYPLEVEESTALTNCRALLSYIDGQFQERLRSGLVRYSKYASECGTYRCLGGWCALDVFGVIPTKEGKTHLEYLGHQLGLNDFEVYSKIFNSDGGRDIHARRAALVAHIKSLEAQETRQAA